MGAGMTLRSYWSYRSYSSFSPPSLDYYYKRS